MKPHDPNPETAERAALYAAGALTAEECAQFERELANPDVAAALAVFEPAVETLVGVVPEATPPKRVRAALMQRLTEDSVSKAEASGLFIQRKEEGEWRGIGVPGVKVRQLYVDRERRFRTFLMRLEPSCEVPAHFHEGPEECFVLEGDIRSYDTVFRAGDYLRAAAGTQHGVSRTQGGCLLLLTAALDEHSAP